MVLGCVLRTAGSLNYLNLCRPAYFVKLLNYYLTLAMRYQFALFRLFLQWTENFMCGEVADEELWEDAILVTKALHANADPAAIEVLYSEK